MDAITFLRNKGILGEIHTKWMITFSDGSQVDLVQLFDEFAALRQPAVIGSVCTKHLLAAAAVNLVGTKIVTQMKIKELKEKLEANTSEKLFGIDKQPEQNCPKSGQGYKGVV